ncbi:MAG: hypothetical protein IK120_04305 [Muribaculaceae bacterium]|nr:hypothetical protein [Muribaculaceae bacterium]MBR5744739.1 hypothetical protein [Muribaculaceae bacterium]
MKKLVVFLLGLVINSPLFCQTVKDYLGVGETIIFQDTIFELKWSQHPSAHFFNQEWLPRGENVGHYHQMFTVLVLISDEYTPEIAVRDKIAELEERAKTDACCNYNVYEKDGAYILDFLVSAGDGGTISIVESDIHYYKQVTVNGKKALQLLFYSHRAYDDDIMPYLATLKDKKYKWINEISQIDIKLNINE